MLIFLTGKIDGIRDIENFKEAEKVLYSKYKYRTLNLVDINEKDNDSYKKTRLKYLIKSDKVIFMNGYQSSPIALREYEIAGYLNIPTEVYYDTIDSDSD